MYTVTLNNKKYYIEVSDDTAEIRKTEAAEEEFDDLPDFEDGEQDMGAKCTVAAPLPCTVRKVLVNEGERVQKNQILFICEAMKMELEVAAPAAGTVAAIKTAAGKHEEKGAELAYITG